MHAISCWNVDSLKSETETQEIVSSNRKPTLFFTHSGGFMLDSRNAQTCGYQPAQQMRQKPQWLYQNADQGITAGDVKFGGSDPFGPHPLVEVNMFQPAKPLNFRSHTSHETVSERDFAWKERAPSTRVLLFGL